MQTNENKMRVGVQPIKVGRIKAPIRGKTALGMDDFPDEVKKQILAKQAGIAKGNKKKVRDIKQETQDAIHITSTGKIGFPASGFKKGMMNCTSRVGDKFFSKSLVSGAVKIINGEDGLIPIKFKKQTVWEHTIKGNTKFTPLFHDWSCELEIEYDQNNISAQDIITLLNYAGFYCGLGIDRPKGRDGGSGEHGMYEVLAK